MNTDQKSLRWLIDKWLAPTPAMPVRLIRYGLAGSRQRRCVRVESLRPTGLLAIFFFQHDDGSWCVFPPATRGPVMHTYPRTE
ncbi:hypothetical protein [Paraburkholderia sp. BL10I2N1]|uniref:hypothetical protein n=1 Tax=Paraburkholderia sp. BL10I2N1 TaxID=1938796 RepID=UPI0010606AD6|nr:hypothetical protein [Paraburkholderia sp. BL10I2N1]TDN59173.1 hypothetical protein B0G77_8371 [Paraburkholderia sp. BL10I2N1]